MAAERDKLLVDLATCSSDLIMTRAESKERNERLEAVSAFETSVEQNKARMQELESLVERLTEDKGRLESQGVEMRAEIDRLLVKEGELGRLNEDHGKLREDHKGLCYEHDIALQVGCRLTSCPPPALVPNLMIPT